MKTLLTTLSFFLFSFALQAQSADADAKKKGTTLSGIASYYHSKFEGRKMANGHNYLGSKLTAASNMLPLNRWVRVTNLSNGRSVIVKITDRMARNNKRVIDLSLASAKRISMISQGLSRVRVELLPD